jgi:LPXTG-site transpeptidase (sortase) family protein
MRYQRNDPFLLITTTIENSGAVALDSLEFLRGTDPDNDKAWPGGDFDTDNRVVYQPGESGNPDKALIRAAGTIYPDMLMFLGTVDSRARVSIDKDWEMDTDQVLDAPVTGPRSADEAIALAWRFGRLDPGNSVKVTYFYAFGTDADTEALLKTLRMNCAGTVMTIFGGTATAGNWTVNVPFSAALPGSCLELSLPDPATGGQPGANMKSLQKLMHARMITPDGASSGSLAMPVEVCYSYSTADLATAGFNPLKFMVGVSSQSGSPWTMQTTRADPAARSVCATVADLAYYELFIPTSLPSTGFSPGKVTALAVQPVEKAFSNPGDLRLEIPRLGVLASVVGVPLTGDGWDVSWLGDSAGWLEGTAFPSSPGNSVLTGHVWDATNRPGLFVSLHTLGYGDQVILHAWERQYVYAVRAVEQARPEEIDAMLRHEESPWLTLVTCRGYDEKTGFYSLRVLVRAELVSIK